VKQYASQEGKNDRGSKDDDSEQSRALDTTQVEARFAAKSTIEVIVIRLFELLLGAHLDSSHHVRKM
jgi:hypothetical protein